MINEPHDIESHDPLRAGPATRLLAVAAVCAIAAIGASNLVRPPRELPAGTSLADAADLCDRVDDAYLSGELFGAVGTRIEWRGTDMRCQGGLRPDGEGIRLVFAATGDAGAARLVFVIGISGPLRELPQAERAANVTVIDESSGLFFSSRGQDRCWTTVSSVTGDGEHYRVDGEVYCAGSLPAVANGGSIVLRGFRYAGRLTLDAT